MHANKHSVLYGVEIGIRHGNPVACIFAHLRVVIRRKEATKLIGTNRLHFGFVTDLPLFQGKFQRFDHSFVTKPVVKFGHHKVKPLTLIRFSDPDKIGWGHAAAVAIQSGQSMGTHVLRFIAEHQVFDGESFPCARSAE
jgi:hypothetical protein